MIPIENVKEELNTRLKKHPQYESWMNFAAVNEEDYICTPLVQNPKKGETQLKKTEWMDVYKQVTAQVTLN